MKLILLDPQTGLEVMIFGDNTNTIVGRRNLGIKDPRISDKIISVIPCFMDSSIRITQLTKQPSAVDGKPLKENKTLFLSLTLDGIIYWRPVYTAALTFQFVYIQTPNGEVVGPSFQLQPLHEQGKPHLPALMLESYSYRRNHQFAEVVEPGAKLPSHVLTVSDIRNSVNSHPTHPTADDELNMLLKKIKLSSGGRRNKEGKSGPIKKGIELPRNLLSKVTTSFLSIQPAQRSSKPTTAFPILEPKLSFLKSKNPWHPATAGATKLSTIISSSLMTPTASWNQWR